MPFMPFNILGVWFRGLLAVAVIAGGLYLLKRWYDESHVVTPAVVRPADGGPEKEGGGRGRAPAVVTPGRRTFHFVPGANRETAYLAAGAGLLLVAFAGGVLRSAASAVGGGPRRGPADEEPAADRSGTVHRVERPDGSELRVECYGPADAPPVVMTHGWGCDSTEWTYAKRSLAGRFRLILWDEPGLGLSKPPDDGDYRMETLAADLKAVLAFAGGRPAVLVGHSIGGMITLTLCKTFPELMGREVAGLVLVHTTYTNPVRTTKGAAFYSAIEKPVIVPLLYLTIALWPLVWVMNWLSYLNGSVHRSTHRQSFSGGETRGQLDFCARYAPRARPDVLARGMLGMIGYDATEALAAVGVPTLVVVGDADTTTPPEAGAYISRHVPAGRLETLSPAKHLGLFEHHARFDGLVGSFVESCLVTGASR